MERTNSLDIKNGVSGVHSSLILCRLTDQTLLISEGDERGGCKATLLVGNCAVGEKEEPIVSPLILQIQVLKKLEEEGRYICVCGWSSADLCGGKNTY